jgi:hypothetical protein
MKKISGWVLAALALVGLAAQAADYPLVDAVECRARGGLPNFLARAAAGGEISVAYFGGSITAADGWRPKSFAWLKQQFPKAQFTQINAAIGGTGSDLGVFRNQYDVLRHKPQLVFVEFAVNDGGADPIRIHQTIEGIVRQTWQADPTTDICFVYTLAHNQLDDLSKGKFQRSASAMEAVADHYGIPSIHFGVEVARLVKEGKLVFKGEVKKDVSPMGPPMIFSTDGVHPLSETGHELYLQTIQRSWPAITAASAKAVAPHKLGAPLRADNWEAAKMVPLAPALLQGQWEQLDPAKNNQAKAFAVRMPALWKACAPGATLSFSFKGKAAAIYDLLGPDGGILTVKLDDQPEHKATMIDGYCTNARIAKLDCGSDLPEGLHHVTVKLTDQVPDKEKILFEKNRADLKQHPEKYSSNVWYAGALLLLGDLAE